MPNRADPSAGPGASPLMFALTLIVAFVTVITGLLTGDWSFHLLAAGAVLLGIPLAIGWRRYVSSSQAGPAAVGLAGLYSLVYGSLLPAEMRAVNAYVTIPGRTPMLVVGGILVAVAAVTLLMRSRRTQ